MSMNPIFTSLDLKKVKPLSVTTDFDVYENYYFATDMDTLIKELPNEVNKTLRQGYGLLNDDFLVRNAVLNREGSIPGICVRLHFYRPLHFETFCQIGQEHSEFHDKYFSLCARYLSRQLNALDFTDLLKQLEKENKTNRFLYTQDYSLFTSLQTYDESIPEHIYKEENGVHPYIEMYQNARDEAKSMIEYGWQFVNFHPYNPIVNGTVLKTSENHFTICLSLFRLRKLSIEEAHSIYSFETPEYSFRVGKYYRVDTFYKEFAKASLFYLMSELSADEFYTKLLAIER